MIFITVIEGPLRKGARAYAWPRVWLWSGVSGGGVPGKVAPGPGWRLHTSTPLVDCFPRLVIIILIYYHYHYHDMLLLSLLSLSRCLSITSQNSSRLRRPPMSLVCRYEYSCIFSSGHLAPHFASVWSDRAPGHFTHAGRPVTSH